MFRILRGSETPPLKNDPDASPAKGLLPKKAEAVSSWTRAVRSKCPKKQENRSTKHPLPRSISKGSFPSSGYEQMFQGFLV
jgi:hypothetical protein